MSNKITKATIERLVESQGVSDVAIQVATARYDQCKDDKERNALHKELQRKAGGTKAKQQNKAVEAGSSKASAKTAPVKTKKAGK
jgi:hypothetical protein